MASNPSLLETLPLASEFPAQTEADWRRLVEGVLKGASYEKKLVAISPEGLRRDPISPRRVDAPMIAPSRGAEPWLTSTRVDDPDLARANATLLVELAEGANALSLVVSGNPAARGFGLPEASEAVFASVLAGVHIDLVPIRLEASPHAGRGAAKAISAYVKNQRLPASTMAVDFGLAPFHFLAETGSLEPSLEGAMTKGRDLVRLLQDQGFHGPFFRVDGRPFHDAGAGEAQELATLIAQAVSLLRGLDAAGIAPAEAASWLSFTLALDQEQFAGIAKIRALRLLWARVEAVLGLKPRAIPIHAETSFRMMTRRDTQVNMLRATIAALTGAIGGADSLSILPFTLANGLPDAAARRLARNTSLILAQESNLYRMVDASAGAGAVEALTDQMAELAWALFQQIEQERGALGAEPVTGFPAALVSGMLARHIAQTRTKWLRDIATRRWPITGTSEFPSLIEPEIQVHLPAPVMTSRSAFPAMRLAEPFEALRDQADALAASGHPPRVFLANLGRIADFTPRATFAKAAYEAGGIEALGNDGFADDQGTDLVAMTDAFKASGARLACIASTDMIYAEEAADAAIALLASGAQAVHLAGRPGEQEARLRASGITRFLSAGMDLPAFLADILAELAGQSSMPSANS
jgi:methylmalonyl-CoA mutase